MKTTKFVLVAALMAVITGAFGDAANILVSFSTPGPDKYADGQTVLDGEWYALVWSKDGKFDGLNLDLTPVDKNDQVAMMYPIAKNGRCPYVVFQIDSQSEYYHLDGFYDVYLLDTRNAAKNAVAAKNPETGKPATVNAAVAVADGYTKSSETKSGELTAKTDVEQSASWTASAVDTAAADFKQPKITAIAVEGAQVKITVADMMPGINYTVKMGDAPGKLSSYAAEVKTAGDDATFFIDQKDGKFFQVVREPLKK